MTAPDNVIPINWRAALDLEPSLADIAEARERRYADGTTGRLIPFPAKRGGAA